MVFDPNVLSELNVGFGFKTVKTERARQRWQSILSGLMVGEEHLVADISLSARVLVFAEPGNLGLVRKQKDRKNPLGTKISSKR